MRIYDADITGSLTYNGQLISSFGTVDAVSSSVVILKEASGSFSTRVTSVESSLNNLDNTYATDAQVATAVSSLNAATSSYLKNTTDTLTGDLTVTGTITAQEFHTEFVSASIIYQSGSTQFGNSSDDTHIFTGNILQGNTVVNPASGFANVSGIGLKYSTTAPTLEVSSDSVALNLNRTTTGGAGVIAEFRSANNIVHSFGTANSSMSSVLTLKNAYGDSSGLKLFQDSSNVSTIANYYNGPILFNTSNTTERMRIDATGNVGIGTDVPAGRLKLKQASDEWYAGLRIHASGSNQMAGLGVSGSVAVLASSWDNTGTFSDLAFFTSDVEKMRLDTNGNLGIGTNDPGYKLDINGTLGVAGASTFVGDISIANVNPILNLKRTNNASSPAARINFLTSDDTVRWQIATNQSIGTGFEINQGDGTNPRLYIDTNGNVGIGTTSPQAHLDVVSSTLTKLRVRTTGVADASMEVLGYDAGVHLGDATNGNRWAIWNDGVSTSSPLNFGSYALGSWYVPGSQVMTLTHDGKVGIGTTSPGVKLDVVSDIRTTTRYLVNTGTANENMAIGYWDTVNARIEAGSALPMYITSYEGNIKLGIAGATTMTVKTSSVGIGSTNPASTLDVQTAGSAGIARISADGNGAVYSANGDVQLYTNDAAYSTSIYAANKGNLLFRVQNDGNVGIGTTSPAFLFHVNGTGPDLGYIATNFTTNTTNGRLLHIRDDKGAVGTDSIVTVGWTSSPGQDVYIGKRTTSSAGYFALQNSSGNEIMTGDMANQRIGIGTTSPSDKLHVHGGGLIAQHIQQGHYSVGASGATGGSSSISLAFNFNGQYNTGYVLEVYAFFNHWNSTSANYTYCYRKGIVMGYSNITSYAQIDGPGGGYSDSTSVGAWTFNVDQNGTGGYNQRILVNKSAGSANWAGTWFVHILSSVPLDVTDVS